MTSKEQSLANAKADVDSGLYEEGRALKEHDSVLDLGAHVGYFTEYAAKKIGLGRVLALEPDPENFTELLARTRNYSNVHCLNAAASDGDSMGTLWHHPEHTGGHSLRPFEGAQALKCLIFDIGNLLSSVEFVPTFVKIDTEGSEYLILKSLMHTRCRSYITFEVHADYLYKSCRELLEKYGYDVYPKHSIVGVVHAKLRV